MNTFETFRKTYQRFTAISAALTNCLLIHLIINKSPKSLGSYKYLMIYISIFELVYATMDHTLKIEVVTKETYWLAVCNPLESMFPKFLQYPGAIFWSSCFGLSLGNFSVHFIFRYLVIEGNKEWTSDCGRRILFWLCSAMSFGVAWGSVVHVFEHRDLVKDGLLKQNLSMFPEVPIEKISYYGFSFDFDTNRDWPGLIGIGVLTVLVILSFFIMIYFGTKCYKALQTMTNHRSNQYKSLQAQLFFALVFQTLIPVVLLHIPCLSVLFLPVLAILIPVPEVEFGGVLVSFVIATFTVIDPLPNFIIIKSYREALKGYITGCWSYSTRQMYPLEVTDSQSRIVKDSVNMQTFHSTDVS